MTAEPEVIAEAVDLIVQSARQIDFELLHERREAVATLIVNARYLADLTAGTDPFESSLPVMIEMRRRRKLE